MADLGEYLGHILCEVTRARVTADLEALRVAREYAGDQAKLLRNFPVPRMRLPTLEIVVPVQVQEIPEGYVEKTTADTKSLAKVLAGELGPALRKQKLSISTADITKLIKDDPLLSRGRIYDGIADSLCAKLHEYVRPLAKQSATASPAKGERTPAEAFKEISLIIRQRIDKALTQIPRRPAGISIEARTAVIREVGVPALLLNIKLTISEEAMEIHLDEEAPEAPASEGESGSVAPAKRPRIKRLVPE